ncbi:MAG TPA: hypothetical protein VF017_24145 [Thermoanaerobaculia bacterium]|nr:hypothetical protein [Thermoanaerobaculia bacterium]
MSRPERDGLLAETSVHALAWLAAGNAFGLLLATLLLAPGLTSLLTPFHYGRLVPVHLNLQLYGWCALPLVALLFRSFVPRRGDVLLPRFALWGWSAVLASGAVSWLAGVTTGKPFLDWNGLARAAFLGELLVLELALALAWLPSAERKQAGPRANLIRGAVLLALLSVPAALAVATRPQVYPPINPATGGPTGGSLLGSTLGVVVLFVACPSLFGLAQRTGRRGPGGLATASLLAGHVLAFLLLDHGDHSHRELAQLLAVASLLVWPPWLTLYLGRFVWPAATRRWLLAFGAWGAVLFGSAVLTFLPGVLDRLKFTDALVAHAHLAMAGMSTAFLMLILAALGEESGLAAALDAPRPFQLWNAGLALMIVALGTAGALEGADPGLGAQGGTALTVAYTLRWLAGAAMLAASWRWLRGALATVQATESVPGACHPERSEGSGWTGAERGQAAPATGPANPSQILRFAQDDNGMEAA